MASRTHKSTGGKVKAHTRKLKNGKTVKVKGYTRKKSGHHHVKRTHSARRVRRSSKQRVGMRTRSYKRKTTHKHRGVNRSKRLTRGM